MYWHKNSAEYKALCLQAYNTAKIKLDLELSKNHKKKLAIVADLDETIFNNTPYNEMLIEEEATFNQENWSNWVNKKTATAIPGSLDFFKYAESKGVEIIYLSNRRIENYEPTKENLVTLGFPFDDSTKMLLRTDSSDKYERRKSISDQNIIMFIGDNLGDFDSVFFDKSNEQRWEISKNLKEKFGHQFILIPNLIYGDWERGFNN
jgi:5'-nucleotidase (lipoprotein e(P4) family)